MAVGIIVGAVVVGVGVLFIFLMVSLQNPIQPALKIALTISANTKNFTSLNVRPITFVRIIKDMGRI